MKEERKTKKSNGLLLGPGDRRKDLRGRRRMRSPPRKKHTSQKGEGQERVPDKLLIEPNGHILQVGMVGVLLLFHHGRKHRSRLLSWMAHSVALKPVFRTAIPFERLLFAKVLDKS